MGIKNIYWFVNYLRVFLFKNKNKQVVCGDGLVVKKTIVKGAVFGNKIVIGDNVRLTNCTFDIHGTNNTIVIGNNANLHGVVFWMGENGNEVIIGNETTIEGNTELAACEGTKIVIGDDCMFSHSILVRTTDSHSIINGEGKRINPAENIHIGNHVWVGLQSLILKGTDVPDNSVVGARSVVSSSKDFEQNSVIVGCPAKCVRKNINWLRDRI